MERQTVIDVRVPVGPGRPGSGTLLIDKPPPRQVAPEVAAAPARALHVWLWRTMVAIAVLLAVAGLAAWASSPPV